MRPHLHTRRWPASPINWKAHRVAKFIGALGHGDLDVGHHLGDLAAERNGIDAAFHGGEVEPFMRGDQVDDAGAPARPVQAALEQYVGDRACFTGVAVSISIWP